MSWEPTRFRRALRNEQGETQPIHRGGTVRGRVCRLGRSYKGPPMFKAAPYILLGTLCAAPALLTAQQAKPQSFSLPGHGQLLLAIPSAWKVEVHQPPGPMPPTLEFSPKEGAPFHALLTATWPVPAGAPPPDLPAIRERVGAAANAAETQSVEKTVLVRELSGASTHGYYFTATDRAPKPGEFKYLTQGIIQVGAVDVAFSVVTNDGQDTVIKAALEMLRTAAHVAQST